MFHKICWFSNLEKYPKGCINNNCNYLHPGQEYIRGGKRANESVDSEYKQIFKERRYSSPRYGQDESFEQTRKRDKDTEIQRLLQLCKKQSKDVLDLKIQLVDASNKIVKDNVTDDNEKPKENSKVIECEINKMKEVIKTFKDDNNKIKLSLDEEKKRLLDLEKQKAEEANKFLEEIKNKENVFQTQETLIGNIKEKNIRIECELSNSNKFIKTLTVENKQMTLLMLERNETISQLKEEMNKIKRYYEGIIEKKEQNLENQKNLYEESLETLKKAHGTEVAEKGRLEENNKLLQTDNQELIRELKHENKKIEENNKRFSLLEHEKIKKETDFKKKLEDKERELEIQKTLHKILEKTLDNLNLTHGKEIPDKDEHTKEILGNNKNMEIEVSHYQEIINSLTFENEGLRISLKTNQKKISQLGEEMLENKEFLEKLYQELELRDATINKQNSKNMYLKKIILKEL